MPNGICTGIKATICVSYFSNLRPGPSRANQGMSRAPIALRERTWRSAENGELVFQQASFFNGSVFWVLALILSCIHPSSVDAQCSILNTGGTNVTVGNGYLWAQGFLATCSGPLDSVEFYSAEDGVLAGDTLRVYFGNPVSGTPIYVQPFSSFPVTAGGPIRIPLTGGLNLMDGEQYAFQFKVTGVDALYSISDPYAGGTAFQGNTQASWADMNFGVHMNSLSTPIGERPSEATISVYPNPVVDRLHIRFGSPKGSVVVRLVDPLGRMVYASLFRSCSELTVPIDASSGTYFLLLDLENGGTRAFEVFKL